MESYSVWLYDELENDGVIDSSEVELEDLTTSFLLSTTDLFEDDLNNYAAQYREHCENLGVTPIFDLED